MGEVITRPDGRSYRPRKIRAVFLDGWSGDGDCCLVLGTRDEALARELADCEIRSYDGSLRAGDSYPGWWRLTIRRGELCYDWDDVRGAAGLCFGIAGATGGQAPDAGPGPGAGRR